MAAAVAGLIVDGIAARGDEAVEVRLALTGEAAAWGWITPATMTLASSMGAAADSCGRRFSRDH